MLQTKGVSPLRGIALLLLAQVMLAAVDATAKHDTTLLRLESRVSYGFQRFTLWFNRTV